MKITAQDLRTKYLEFFKSKGHSVIPSASLVPEGDSSVLFTTAGMHPLVPYLLGQEHPNGKRLANVQKCIRTGDIEEVGDLTHLTFFEMCGNWSLGDYFKKEAITWSFEFLTDPKWLGLSLDRLAFTCFAGDEDAPRDTESAEIWKSLGVPENRISFLPKEKNWWIAGDTGPCGPDTEMHYWIDDGRPVPEKYDVNEPRWVEIWNDVFMQFEKLPDGKLIALKKPNVDTGLGLERVLTVLNGSNSVYDTELFKPMWEVLALDQKIMTNDEVKKARIILDHIRASVFIVSDGVEPSNKDRGYVLRKLLRRAMVMGRLLNLKHHWLEALIGKVVSSYASNYPELVEKSSKTYEVILAEQKKFEIALEKGFKVSANMLSKIEKELKPMARRLKPDGSIWDMDEEIVNRLENNLAFNWYQTYSVPLEFIIEIAKVRGLPINEEVLTQKFYEQLKQHQELSRTSSAGQFKGGLASHSEKIVRLHTATHLLNAALRQVLGENVWQKGSNITEERTRFDFTHDKKMTPEEIAAVEVLVNDWITRDLKVKRETMPLEEARKLGAIGVFGEKYADTVSIYTVYDPTNDEVISREFCGGPHVEHTGVIGQFKIQKEEASSAGVRRIKALII